LSLDAASEFKLTRGDWGKVMKKANGNDYDNVKWNGKSKQVIVVEKWADKPETITAPPPAEPPLPAEAIKPGKNTIVVNVGTVATGAKYYLVKKGATTLDGASPLYQVGITTQMAGAVPKEAGAEYIVVKDVIAKMGVNGFGYDITVKLDGMTNPVKSNVSIGGFKTEYTPPYPTTSLLLVGGTTPAGWNNSGSNTQTFTSTATGKFTITINLDPSRPDPGMLIIPVVGNWDSKIGKASGTPLSGILSFGSANLDAPTTAGNYKIDVDFVAATYTLTKLP
jgi:hypothetical protein